MTGRISVFLALCVLGAAVVAAIALRGSDSEAALSPVPSFHVDIGSSPSPASTDNSYVEDPSGDTDASDQLMSLTTPLTRCVRRDVNDFGNIGQVRIVTDIIIQDAQEMAGADVRINFNPAQIQFVSASITPFTAASDFVTGFTGQVVGLINLPVEPFSGGTHRTASPGFNSDNTNGAVFLAGTYLGLREFDVSSESGPTVDSATNSLPNRNAGQAPNGGVFVRINWNLQAASSGQDVRIDLKTGVPSFIGGGDIETGSKFVTLTGESPPPFGASESINIPFANLFDGVISVNKDIPDPCPQPQPPPPPLGVDDIDLFPKQPDANNVGTSHTVTARVIDRDLNRLPGIEVLICVLEGPNAHEPCDEGDASITGFTDSSSGELLLTYTSNGEPGTDTIRGCVLSDSVCSTIDGFAFKTWVEPPPPPPPPADSITLAPENATNSVGTSHSVTATVTEVNIPVGGVEVLICVLKGPNIADPCVGGDPSVTGLTDANGRLALTYTSNGETGTDEIFGCILSDCNNIFDKATKVWAKPTLTPAPTPGPGTPTPTVLAEEQAPGGVPSTGNPGAAGGSGSDWPLYALASSLLLVAASSGGLLWMSRRRIAWPWRRQQSGG